MSLGTIYRSFGFTESCNGVENCGNDLIRETDARGGKTYYDVDEDTSRNEVVTDRCGNKTAYEYDTAGRTTRVISKDPGGTELANVSYAYDAFDNLTEIARGDGMKYVLAYNAFHNLQSIGIEGKTENLVSYVYKNGNGRLKSVTYANGDTMKASYNSVGQMVAEKWYDASGALTAHYKYTYDDQGNIVRSIDMTAGKEYNYTYEEGKLVRAAECGITLSGEIVTAKSVVNTIKYYYDTEGKLIRKVITPASGSAQTIYYENGDGNTVVKFAAGGRTVTSHSKSDSFGRKVFDELQLGTDFVSRQFTYHAGKVTDEHKDNAKVKSSATTQLVSQITFSDGRTLSYAYDAEERITKITDSIEGVTEYTYDAMGQLLTETVNGEVVNTMTYDSYGNIVSKNGVAYTYGDSVWKDRLTAYDGEAITYDAQGNPTTYLGHALTWEKGRQLKSFDNIQYTYNANGIRTSKTVNGVQHTYTLDGTKMLRETWNGNTLVPLYDNEDSVCGVLYNNTPFYFQKNLQGDVIAIANSEGTIVARYSYDAWGKCTVLQDTSGRYIASVNPFRYRGYYYDSEIGMYYLQSRYYDPEIGRFINADESLTVASGHWFVMNYFAYCYNSPVNRTDNCGYGFETAFDILSVLWSLAELAAAPSWANVGYLIWDIASVIVPVAPGSYVVKGGKVIKFFASKIDDFVDGTKILTGAYNKLKKLFKGIKGIEIHHLIEKRFKNLFRIGVNDFLSVPLTKELHKIITKRWRNLHKISSEFRFFRYGSNYRRITYEMMEKAIREVYKDMPELLEEVLEWFRKYWGK